MHWDEKWRHEERPDPEDIPDEYSIRPTKNGRIIVTYFVSLFGVFYLLFRFFGTEPILLGGIPLLILLNIGLVALTLLGVYLLLWPQETKAMETAEGSATGAGD